jgi:retron-type reverse transcriptase
METLREAYKMTRKNKGASGIDGVTFHDIEGSGVESFLQQIRDELVAGTYRPLRYRSHEIPKGNGGFRTLKIPAIRDRVVQGALKLILERIFEADFQEGSYGYRPKRTPQQAVQRVSLAALSKSRVLDVDKMLERAREVTRKGRYTRIEYAVSQMILSFLWTARGTGIGCFRQRTNAWKKSWRNWE